MSFDTPGVVAVSAGAILCYAGVRGYSVGAMIQNLVLGKPPLTGVDLNQPLANDTPSGTSTFAPGLSLTGNRELARKIIEEYWPNNIEEWYAADWIFNKESSYNNRATNPSSGAYGLGQAWPYDKMPQAAWPESAGGQSDPETQIRWTYGYIGERYGSPTMAKAFHEANGWY